MVGDIKLNRNNPQGNDGSNLYAIATLDGLLMLAKRDTILW